MSAVNAFRRIQIKKQAFDRARQIKTTTNFFQKTRRSYLSSVVRGELTDARKVEVALIKRLEEKEGMKLNDVLKSTLTHYLRKGIPLSNCLLILELKSKLLSGDKHLDVSPRYRKKEVLDIELELTQVIFESLRLARRNAEKEGLTGHANNLSIEISAKARLLTQYKKVFNQLVE